MTNAPAVQHDPDTVWGAVLIYAAQPEVVPAVAVGVVPLAQLRDDVEKIIQGHPTVDSARTTPRGHDGACDLDVFDSDGESIALVTIDADGTILACPAVAAAEPSRLDAYRYSWETWFDAGSHIVGLFDNRLDEHRPLLAAKSSRDAQILVSLLCLLAVPG